MCQVSRVVLAQAMVVPSERSAPLTLSVLCPCLLAQSVAREYGPKNVHVSHVIIDGLIESETALEYLGMPKGSRFPDGSVSMATHAALRFDHTPGEHQPFSPRSTSPPRMLHRLCCHLKWQRRGSFSLNSIRPLGRLKWTYAPLASTGSGALPPWNQSTVEPVNT